jgi:hypothetical protein
MQDLRPDPPYDILDRPIAPSLEALKRLIEEQFPEDAAVTSRRSMELWDSDEASGLWFEEFVERTNEAIRSRDDVVVMRHLTFFSLHLDTADDDVRRMIDVNYVENLLCRLDKRAQRWGWRRIPANLKQLYIAFWGKISPGRIAMLEAKAVRK